MAVVRPRDKRMICPGGADCWEKAMERLGRKVLIIDDDEDIATLVDEMLSDEGYAVTILRDARSEAIQDAVAQLQPDCMLLDGGVGRGYGGSWASAALMAGRIPAVPVIMFTAHAGDFAEATENTSERSQAAHFIALLPKPFELPELLRVVALAVDRSHAPDEQ
jgi:CheY-like chemotaxis protein